MPINRGRKSAEEIAIEQIADVVRPEPPKNLDDDEAKVWREVVDRMPPNWFPRETHGLLAQYCKHEAAVVFIDKIMTKIKRAAVPDLKLWNKMSRERRLESKMIMLLATKMRLSQQSSYNKGTAGTAKVRATENKSRTMWE